VKKPTADQVAWVFRHLANHLREGGTFRYLIYDRMGFDNSAYSELHGAGGMDISNALNDTAYEKYYKD
jgi:hypothetical protein